jgi:uncharacterized protein (TIGR00156 family)
MGSYWRVKMKNKTLLAGIIGIMLVFGTGSVYAQGFTGPGAGTSTRQVQTVTVSQAKSLPDDSLVTLTGTIVQALRGEKYTFRDSTGDITIEIDRDLWSLLGISVGVNDRVEIRGYVDVEGRNRIAEIDVKYIGKL